MLWPINNSTIISTTAKNNPQWFFFFFFLPPWSTQPEDPQKSIMKHFRKLIKISFILNSREITRLGNQNKRLEFSTFISKSKYISWIFKTNRNLGNRWLGVRSKHLWTGKDSSIIVSKFQESHFVPQFRNYRAEINKMESTYSKRYAKMNFIYNVLSVCNYQPE